MLQFIAKVDEFKTRPGDIVDSLLDVFSIDVVFYELDNQRKHV